MLTSSFFRAKSYEMYFLFVSPSPSLIQYNFSPLLRLCSIDKLLVSFRRVFVFFYLRSSEPELWCSKDMWRVARNNIPFHSHSHIHISHASVSQANANCSNYANCSIFHLVLLTKTQKKLPNIYLDVIAFLSCGSWFPFSRALFIRHQHRSLCELYREKLWLLESLRSVFVCKTEEFA